MADNTHKTYVLAGFDEKGAFTDANDTYSKDPNCVVIRVSDYPNLADAVAQIKSPASFILDCHGGEESSFQWSKNASTSYVDLFKTLAKSGAKIDTLTIASCYGGSAEYKDALKELPAGTVVLSLVSDGNWGWGDIVNNYAHKASAATTPAEHFLAAISSFDPAQYNVNAEAFRKANPTTRFNSDTTFALPATLGIAGKNPVLFDLNEEIYKIAANPHLDTKAWDNAVALNKKGFGGTPASGKPEARFEQRANMAVKGLTPDADHIGDAIDAVAEKMKQGKWLPQDGQELRIGRALTVAYLETTGAFAKRVAHQKDAAQKSVTPATQKAAALPLSDDAHILAVQHGAALASMLQNSASGYVGITGIKPVSPDGKTHG